MTKAHFEATMIARGELEPAPERAELLTGFFVAGVKAGAYLARRRRDKDAPDRNYIYGRALARCARVLRPELFIPPVGQPVKAA